LLSSGVDEPLKKSLLKVSILYQHFLNMHSACKRTAKRRRVFVAHGWTREASSLAALEPCERWLQKSLQLGGLQMSSREVERLRRRLARKVPGQLLLGAAARAMTCRGQLSGKRATAWMCYVQYLDYQQAYSGAYYAVATPGRHRRLTSLATLDGGLHGENL
jgi:hypothetical protein